MLSTAVERQQDLAENIAAQVELSEEGVQRTERHLDVTEDDLLEAKELAATYTLDDLRSVSEGIFIHDVEGNLTCQRLDDGPST